MFRAPQLALSRVPGGHCSQRSRGRIQGQLQAFTSLMASMRRALLVTAVVRKMNLYPEEPKAPAPMSYEQVRGPRTGGGRTEPPTSTSAAGLGRSTGAQTQMRRFRAGGTQTAASRLRPF